MLIIFFRLEDETTEIEDVIGELSEKLIFIWFFLVLGSNLLIYIICVSSRGKTQKKNENCMIKINGGCELYLQETQKTLIGRR